MTTKTVSAERADELDAKIHQAIQDANRVGRGVLAAGPPDTILFSTSAGIMSYAAMLIWN